MRCPNILLSHLLLKLKVVNAWLVAIISNYKLQRKMDIPWRKATRILAYHNPLFAQNALQCHFGKDYTCCRTHRRHVQLTGTGEGGKHLSAIAEPYPRKLCNKWAYLILQNQISDHIIQNMKLLTDD